MLTEQLGTTGSASASRRWGVAHWTAVAVLGLAACCVVLALGARYVVAPVLVTPAWPVVGVPAVVPPGSQRATGLGVLAGSAVLVAGWPWLASRAGRVRLRVAVGAAVAWAVPLAVGPPLLPAAHRHRAGGRGRRSAGGLLGGAARRVRVAG